MVGLKDKINVYGSKKIVGSPGAHRAHNLWEGGCRVFRIMDNRSDQQVDMVNH